ncbi:uncharacterized protein LOC132944717 [Metopolophium dirhodum]|uniref:uncharacterized protein LOC132944717 n=1 Tax=Metopolophium dirhodum TaxID=44670 RepID=UPI00298F47BE|nr:uncharacterized protein LOC132944717 [Metopolophium dirhodum]
MPSQHLPKLIKDKYSHLALADPHFDRSAPIDMLLGADVFARIMDGKRVSIDDSLPVAYGSVFCWVLIGELPVQQYHCNTAVSLSVSLEGLVQRFWQLEEPDEAPTTFTSDGQCESIYASESRRDNSGRFLVPLPFIPKHRDETFPGSRNITERRFQNLERKLQNDDVLYTAYKHFMSEYETLGHMSVATEPGAYFIPHHPVFKSNCPSSKIRVVFDGSAKAASLLSLNQCLYAGPKLQLDIVDILFRFRLHQFVFTADVCKMYTQILVLPEYRRFQHILWRPSPLDELKEYQLNTVTYGINSAPFLALRVLRDIADNDCTGFLEVQLGLREQTYVDDICLGADTEDELLTLQSNLCSVLKRAGLELKKWSSNTVSVLEAVSPEDRVMESLSFDEDVCETTKVLGLQWDPAKDIFKFNGHSTTTVVTKWAILSTIARIFDPIGFLAPVTFYAKHILHEIWEEELAWDDPLPPRLCQNWKTFTDELPVLSAIKIPRYVATQRQSYVELCGFCDASERGFAAVVYLRVTVSDDDVSVFLLGSKTKMAPMKTVSIPRLELCASVLLARWMARILKMFDGKLTINGLYAWSDSQVALAWLMNSHVSFKVFISNRVHQVRQLIPSCRWLYVRSSENPADCASRGILPSELSVHALYWSGPTFLKNPSETWSMLVPSVPVEQLPEFKPVSLAVQVTSNKEWFCRFSSFLNMIKVVAWMRRFIGLCKKRTYSNNFLSREEINQSLMVIVQSSQQRWFPELILDLSRGRGAARPLSSLRPFLNS